MGAVARGPEGTRVMTKDGFDFTESFDHRVLIVQNCCGWVQSCPLKREITSDKAFRTAVSEWLKTFNNQYVYRVVIAR